MADTPLERRIEPIDIEEEVKRSYLDYAMSVIVGRALPDAKDGLKPVHRRILWGMQEEGARPGTPYKKSARLVGSVMGKYHPHGDTAIYDALARMAQDFAMRHPLVDGKGNFGSVDGDAPASMRYCVTAETFLRTPHATVRIGDVVSQAQPNSDSDIDIKVLGRRGEPVRATRLFHSGTHPVLKLRTREGYELTGTHNHPLLCIEATAGVPTLQWKRLDQIRSGDHVALLRKPPDELGVLTEREWQRAFLAGALVSEGWVSERRAGFNNLDQEFFREVVLAYDAVVGGARYVNSRVIRSGNLLHELDVHDLTELRRSVFAEMIGDRSEAKKVPSFVWGESHEAKATFLQALFEGDGSCSRVGRTVMIFYSTRSERLAREVQQLLLEFGVVARRSCDSTRREHRVHLFARREVRLFAERVGFYGRKQKKLLGLLAGLPRWTESPKSRDHVPHLAAYVRAGTRGEWRDREWLIKHNIDRMERWERSGDEILRRIADPDVRHVIEPLVDGSYYFAEVASVESSGAAAVYSVRVDSHDHAFIGNGFVNHNTEARLAPLAMELLAGIDEDTVDFTPNYDGEEHEPVAVPARFPNLLVNGSTGIAVGMATNIPPHNLGEVIDAVIDAIDEPDITPAGLMKHVKGPDFPGGGIIMGWQGIKDAYETGRGSIKVRAKATIEESKAGKTQIVVTELPYMVSGDRVLAKVAELVDKKVIVGITPSAKAVRNESNRQGLRLVIELKRDAIPQVVLNNLFKHTQLQDSFGVNMLALVDGVPRTLNLAQAIKVYIGHQVDVVTRRTRYRLRKAEERAHILEGLLVALKNLDAVIKLIRASKDADEARTGLMKKFKLTEIQATAILDMQLRRLAALERQKIEDEHKELMAKIKEYKAILADPKKVRKIVKDELLAIKEKFASPRRTDIRADEADINVEDLIADDEVVLTITRSGYIKRVPANVYRTQGRGGKGIRGAKPKEGDIVEHLLTTTNHAYVLFFSSRGKVYRIKAHEIPEKDRTARGISIRNLLPFSGEDSLAAVIDTRDYETHKFLVIATKKGIIKKTNFSAYDSSRRDGIIAVKLRPDDEVVSVKATSGEDELILVSRKAQAVVFTEAEVRPMGRDASGVIGIRLGPNDEVVAFDVVDPNGELLVVTDNGFGKRTLLTQYPRHHRGGKGVQTAKLTSRRGTIEGAAVVRPGHEVFLISSGGVVIKIAAKDISRMGRGTQGVRVMRLGQGETVSGIARVVADEEVAGTEA